eukprot:GEMP01088629.1.p1 GENE.GEMP01088629.1~~GEMP01088629.1.p1  ORF type:complete len:287 (+),score=34.28 GEMP01088629.1:119-862(+)
MQSFFWTARKNKQTDSKTIIENEYPGCRKEIPENETWNIYGDCARKIEIAAYHEYGAIERTKKSSLPKNTLIIDGRFVYAMKNKPVSKIEDMTGAHVDLERKSDARLCARGFREQDKYYLDEIASCEESSQCIVVGLDAPGSARLEKELHCTVDCMLVIVLAKGACIRMVTDNSCGCATDTDTKLLKKDVNRYFGQLWVQTEIVNSFAGTGRAVVRVETTLEELTTDGLPELASRTLQALRDAPFLI